MTLNWGKSLVIAMVLFVSFIAVIVTKAMKERIDLVAPDYYEREINYDQQQAKLTNAEKVSNQLNFNYLSQEQKINISSEKGAVSEVKIEFYYPANAKFDKKIKVNIQQNQNQEINIANWQNGLWKAKCQYKIGNDLCFKEFSFVK